MKPVIKRLLKQANLYGLAVWLWRTCNPRVRRQVKLGGEKDEQYLRLLHQLVGRPDIYAVQVGSNDGVSNDPLRQYISDFDWHAILIEPVPSIYKKLEELYVSNERVITLNVAITPSEGPKKFYSINQQAKVDLGADCPDWYDQLGSFSRENIERHLNGILVPYIEEIDVDQQRLDEILSELNFPRVDVLHVDAEGYDAQVISTLDLEKTKPRVMIFEHKHLNEDALGEITKTLISAGYEIARFNDDCVAYR